ncbi:hypothetical protein [Mucilaginibacter puniceus]
MKKRILSMVLLAAICATIGTGCGAQIRKPPAPPGAPALPR